VADDVRPDVRLMVDAVERAVVGTSFAGVQNAGGDDPHPVWCGDPVEVARVFPDLLHPVDENGVERPWADEVPCVDLVVEVAGGVVDSVELEGVPVADLLHGLGRPAEAAAVRSVLGTAPDRAAEALELGLTLVTAALRA
jgi:hypothetical protein